MSATPGTAPPVGDSDVPVLLAARPAVGRSRILQSVTVVGWWLAGAAVAAAVVGVLTGWREWLGVGIAAAVVCVLAVLLSLGGFAYEMSMRLSDRRLVVGDSGRIAVRVRNSSRRRLLPAELELAVTDRTYAVTLPGLPPLGVHDVLLPVPTDRRAVLTLGPIAAVRSDPVGLVRRVVSWPFGEKVYVVPRTVQTSGALAGFVRDLEGEESTQRTAADLSFHSLRGYVPGDDRRHISWKKTAVAGGLLVREFLETRRSVVVLALSTDLDGLRQRRPAGGVRAWRSASRRRSAPTWSGSAARSPPAPSARRRSRLRRADGARAVRRHARPRPSGPR